MQAYKADTAWNRGIPCIFFKILIQLYLLRSFLYSLTYCIKEVIEIKFKSVGLWGSYGLKQGNPLLFFQNTDPIVFVLFISLFLTYYIKEGIKGNILDIKFKSVGLWGSYSLKQGNTLQNLNISNQIVYFLSHDLLFYIIYQKGYQW